MTDQAAGILVTVDVVIPRLSPSGSGWEVLLIQRNKQPYQGMWALPGGHLCMTPVLSDINLQTQLPTLLQQVHPSTLA